MLTSAISTLNLHTSRQEAQVRATSPALPFSITSSAAQLAAFSETLSAEMNTAAGNTDLIQTKPAELPLPGAQVAGTAAVEDSLVSQEEEEKINQVSRDLESILTYTLLKQMWATLPKESLLDSGIGSKFYREMWLEEIANRASESGTGFGVAEVVKRELMERAKRELNPAEIAKLI